MELNETELLLLLHEQAGDVSGLGYRLEIAGVDRADYRGTRYEDMHGTGVVSEADEVGEIRKIDFYVDYEGEVGEPDRAVILSVYEDGHINCSKEVRPEIVDELKDAIVEVRSYREYLTPLNSLIDEYADSKFKGQSSRRKFSYFGDINKGFEEMIKTYFGEDTFEGPRGRLYQTLLANIGIALLTQGTDSDDIKAPDSDGYEGVSDFPEFPDDTGMVEQFFQDYARHVLNEPDGIDFEELSNHLHHLLNGPDSESGLDPDWDHPISILEYTIEKYALE